ncbi:reverse transcriptase [Cucumis melo var. makuwa]|uniref:Reverse transcriptase n=1 Tax=Cucumis melo var. makuwa TaxID=1194695 RepID=A0A5A7TWC5_CUCMM|nr:reverse transcriptase [Cucumis melo var. makuwa]
MDLKAIEIDEETEIALQTIMEFPEKGSIKLRGEVQESKVQHIAPSLIEEFGAGIVTWEQMSDPLKCLKKSYPSTPCSPSFECTTYVHSHGPNQTKFTSQAQTCGFIGYPLHQQDYKCFHPIYRKYFVSMDVIFLEDHPFFAVSMLQRESVSEELNCVVPLESTSPTFVTLPLPNRDPYNTALPTNQITWITYNRRNLKKEVGQMGENDRSDIAVLKDISEKGNVHEIEVMAEATGDEAEQEHSSNLDEYNLSIDIPIEAPLSSPKDIRGYTDYTLFIDVSKAGKIVVSIVYVNDIVLSGSSVFKGSRRTKAQWSSGA